MVDASKRSLAGLALAMSLGPLVGSVQAQSSCGAIGTGAGPDRLRLLKEALVATDTGSKAYRNGFGLVGVDSSAVAVVTDTAACSAVTAAIDAAFAGPMRSGPLVVIRAGSMYIAFEADAEPQPTFYVDSTYTFKVGSP